MPPLTQPPDTDAAPADGSATDRSSAASDTRSTRSMRISETPWPIRAPYPAARTRGRTKRRATTATVAASSGATEVAALLRRRRASRAPCARRTISSTRTRSCSRTPGPSAWCAWKRARASSLAPAATASFARRAWCDSEGPVSPLGRLRITTSLSCTRCRALGDTLSAFLYHHNSSRALGVSLGNPTYQKKWWMRRRPRPCRPSTTIAP